MFSWSPDLELIQMPWHNPKRAELSRQPRNIETDLWGEMDKIINKQVFLLKEN